MERNLRFKVDWASLIVGSKFIVFGLFTLYLKAISKYNPPGGLYLEGRFKGGFFCVTSLGGFYLEGLIFRIDGIAVYGYNPALFWILSVSC